MVNHREVKTLRYYLYLIGEAFFYIVRFLNRKFTRTKPIDFEEFLRNVLEKNFGVGYICSTLNNTLNKNRFYVENGIIKDSSYKDAYIEHIDKPYMLMDIGAACADVFSWRDHRHDGKITIYYRKNFKDYEITVKPLESVYGNHGLEMIYP